MDAIGRTVLVTVHAAVGPDERQSLVRMLTLTAIRPNLQNIVLLSSCRSERSVKNGNCRRVKCIYKELSNSVNFSLRIFFHYPIPP